MELESTTPAVASGSESYTIDAANNQLAVRSGTSYSSDAAGRLLSDGVRTFSWDSLGRLRQVEANAVVLASYGYDSQNRRVRKTVGAKTTYYLYDLESRLIAELSGSGRVLREYVRLESEPLALREYELRPGLYFSINDHLGTPQQLVTADGTVVWQAAYLPFGEAQVQLGTVQNNLRFPGQYFDVETGFHYNWNRFYDPETGRYLSPDPIGLDGGMNLYAYVDNDPVNFFDPEGLDRYNMCRGKGSVYEFFCRMVVNYGCSGSKKVVCCNSERQECLSKIDFNDHMIRAKEMQCFIDWGLCITGARHQRKGPPIEPIPYPTK